MNLGALALTPAGVGTFVQTGGASSLGSLTIGGPGHGSYTLSAGTLSVTGALTLASNGTLSISNATATAGSVMNGGLISLGGVSGTSTAGNLDIAGTYAQSSVGELDMALGGTEPGTHFGVLGVTGATALAGVLRVSLANGYEPQPGDAFSIITSSTGAVSGTFSTAILPEFAGGYFAISYESTSVVLTAIESIPGDADNNGIVDLNDLNAVLNHLGVSAVGSAARGDRILCSIVRFRMYE